MSRKLSNGEIFTMADDLIQLKKAIEKSTQTTTPGNVTPSAISAEPKKRTAPKDQILPIPDEQKLSQNLSSTRQDKRDFAYSRTNMREQTITNQNRQLNTQAIPSSLPIPETRQTDKSLEELLPMEEVVVKRSEPSLKNEDSVVSIKAPASSFPGSEKSKSDLENEIFPSPYPETPKLPTQKFSPPKKTSKVPVSPPHNLPIGSPTLSSTHQAENKPSDKISIPQPKTSTEQRTDIPPVAEKVSPPPSTITNISKNEPAEKLPTPIPQSKDLAEAQIIQKPFSSVKKSTLPPAPPTPIKKPKKKLFTNKLMITLSAIILLTVILGGGLFLYTSKKDSGEKNQITKDKEIIKPPTDEEKFVPIPPASLITPDFVQELIINDTGQTTLKNTLDSLDSTIYPNNSITYLPIRVKGIFIEGKAQYLDAEMFFSSLNIVPPADFFDIVDSNFMLYIYGSGDEERIICQNNLISQNSCYGPRLGMVFQALENKENELLALVDTFKEIIETTNLDILILNSIAQFSEEGTIFFIEEYQSTSVETEQVVEVSYTNLLMPSYNNLQLSATSLDFAVVNNMLIIGTSKNAVFSMIDKILSE